MSTTPAYKGRIKYDDRRSRAYAGSHKPTKHRAEMRLVSRAFAVVPRTHRILDAPCGGGRVTLHLATNGYRVTRAADLSESMLKVATEAFSEAGLAVPVEKQDVENLTYQDREFDTVICFRLFHHFPNKEIRHRVVQELCRVARKYVVLSYFSPYSVTSVQRLLRAATGGRKSQKHPTPLAEVKGYFKEAGFKLVKDFARLSVVHTLHLALFERTGER
jgi:ubiquinone/menaquinone biosynthesis C-methylase UbiE